MEAAGGKARVTLSRRSRLRGTQESCVINVLVCKILTHYQILPLSLMQERLVSVVYGLLRQGKLHFLTALREELFNFLKAQVKEVCAL